MSPSLLWPRLFSPTLLLAAAQESGGHPGVDGLDRESVVPCLIAGWSFQPLLVDRSTLIGFLVCAAKPRFIAAPFRHPILMSGILQTMSRAFSFRRLFIDGPNTYAVVKLICRGCMSKERRGSSRNCPLVHRLTGPQKKVRKVQTQ